MKYILPLLLFGLLQSCQNTNTIKDAPHSKPNIVLIMADDIGFSDIGCYGSEIATPNLDRLAGNGMRFTQFYNMAKCNPTRSSLITGLYKGGNGAVPLPKVLSEAGYATFQSGKEHFDPWVPKYCYTDNIFDSAFHFWATTEYFEPPSSEFSRPFFLHSKEVKPADLDFNQKPFYKTDVFTDYGLRWIEQPIKEKKPFFLYLPYHAAHYPLQARPEDIALYRGKYKVGWDSIRAARFEKMKKLGIVPKDTRLSPPEGNINRFRGHPKGYEEIRKKIPLYRPWNSLSEKEKDDLDLEMAVFAGMVHRLDVNIGRVIDKLEQEGILDNTLILFLTDNGSCPFDSNKDFEIPPGGADSYRSLSAAWANVGNTPFRYFKQFGHEGGCNTHFIAHWPEKISANSINNSPGHLVDIFPTFMEIAQGSYPKTINDYPTLPLHGKSLMPLFKGESRTPPAFIISGLDKFRMYREGNWKIVRSNNEAWELYNLAEDMTELNNLAKSHPEKLQELEQNYKAVVDTLGI
ncbi:MAG: arylsulfatase [Bacteroidota bacterium]